MTTQLGSLPITIIILLAVSLGMVVSDDLPCVSMLGAGGYVCVCNETYCDTVETPAALERGSYYFYSTSELTPGFTKTVGTFLNTTASLEVQQTATSTNISADVYIWLEPTVEFQTFEGIGAAFTDNPLMLISNLTEAAQQKLIECFYGVTGLEYTFIRLPIGCSDFSPSAYTYDEVPGDVNLEYFNLTSYDYDYKIPYLKMAKNVSTRGVDIISTSWTAPAWMKTNNDTSVPGYIRQEYYQAWADYQIKFLEAYKNVGIDVYALSMGNEVTLSLLFGGFFDFPNVMMLPAEARLFTREFMGPTLKGSAFSDVKLLFMEDDRTFMTWWSGRMFVDEEVLNYIDGIAVHWYFDSTENIPKLEQYNIDYPDHVIMYTESSLNTMQTGGAPVNLGDWSRAVRYINNMFQNFQHWVVGYIDWNIVLNPSGGPAGPSGDELDASVIVNITSNEFYKQPIYFALGHFSKFIQPGSKRINTTISQQDNTTDTETVEEEMRVSAVDLDEVSTSSTTESPFPTRTPDAASNTVVVVATNNPDGSRSVIAYNPRSETANLIITDPDVGTFNQTVEANSLNSFVFWPNATV